MQRSVRRVSRARRGSGVEGDAETLGASKPSHTRCPEPWWQGTLQTSLVPRASLWHCDSEAHALCLLHFSRDGHLPLQGQVHLPVRPRFLFSRSYTDVWPYNSNTSDPVHHPRPPPPHPLLALLTQPVRSQRSGGPATSHGSQDASKM